MTIPISTNTTIAICNQIQVGDIAGKPTPTGARKDQALGRTRRRWGARDESRAQTLLIAMNRLVCILNTSDSSTVCERAVLADRPLARMRGLLGRSELPSGEGLLLTPAPSIHTAFMRFAIDALFLDRELRVLRVVPELSPWRAAGKRHARSVLELACGEAQRLGVRVGDRLAIADPMFARAATERAR